jgi:hypothetical protein
VLGIALAKRGGTAPSVPAPAPLVAAAPADPVMTGRRRLDRATDYASKLWCSDAIGELEKALDEQPQLRSAPEVAAVGIRCLYSTRGRDRASRFLIERVGPAAEQPLAATLQSEGNAEVRKAAERVLSRLKER